MVKEFGSFLEKFTREYYAMSGYVAVANIPIYKPIQPSHLKKPVRYPSDLDVLAINSKENVLISCKGTIRDQDEFNEQINTLKAAFDVLTSKPRIIEFKDFIDPQKTSKFAVVCVNLHEQVKTVNKVAVGNRTVQVEVLYVYDMIKEMIELIRKYGKEAGMWQAFGDYSWFLSVLDDYATKNKELAFNRNFVKPYVGAPRMNPKAWKYKYEK